MRNFHKFNSQADFEAMYNDQTDNEVTAIGIAKYYGDEQTGGYYLERVDYYDFVDTVSGLYYWGENYYTANRNPSIGEEVKNKKGRSIPNGPYLNTYVHDVRIAHESAYVEPWVSYTVGRGVDYSKPPQEPIAR